MVEFAVVAPVLFLMLFLLIDFGRLVYTYGAISWATREGARLASLIPQQYSDCAILQRVESVGRGFPITADPNSVKGNSDPNASPPGPVAPTPPLPGQGFVYIYPAVAASPPDAGANCNGVPAGLPRPQAGGTPPLRNVAVQVQYGYQPLIPLISSFVPNITVRIISVVRTEY